MTPTPEPRGPESEVPRPLTTEQPLEVLFTPEDLETPLEGAILDRAMQCDRARVGKFDRALLRDMLRTEEDFEVPMQFRGMVLAAACHESGFDPDAEGDHKFSPDKKTPKAIGILQLWPWYTTSPWGPHIDRRDPRASARAWLEHITNQVTKVRRQCHFNKDRIEDIWRVAWVTGVRAPSKTPRCRQAPGHWARFVRWRKTWMDLIDGSRVLAQDDSRLSR